MNILITGGLGFIGYPIVELAASLPEVDQVVSVGRSMLKPGQNLPDNVVHRSVDIADQSAMQSVLNEFEITHVVHAAGLRTSASESNPAAAIGVNVNGTQSMVEAARAVESVECFTLLSTGAIYGKLLTANDESQPIAAANPYNVSKAAAELVLTDSSLPFRTLIIRPAFVIGKPVSGGPILGVIQNLLHDAKLGRRSVWKFADRFFLNYCPDVARAILNLTSHQQAHGVYHIPGHSVKLEMLTERVVELCNAIDYLPIDPQTDLPLPTDLLFDKYTNLFPDDQPTALDSMLKEILNGFEKKESRIDPTFEFFVE